MFNLLCYIQAQESGEAERGPPLITYAVYIQAQESDEAERGPTSLRLTVLYSGPRVW